MASVTFVVPVPEGKIELFRQFAQEALSDRRHHHHSSRQQHGFTKEMVWLHKTPLGEVMVVYLEGKMPEAIQTFISSKEPHDVWMKEKILGSIGLDLEKGLPPEGELIFDYQA